MLLNLTFPFGFCDRAEYLTCKWCVLQEGLGKRAPVGRGARGFRVESQAWVDLSDRWSDWRHSIMCIHVAFWNLLCHSTALRAAPLSFRLTVQSLDPCRARVAQASPWESQASL